MRFNGQAPRVMGALCLFIVLATGCVAQNSFVSGTAPAYSDFLGSPQTDIIDKGQGQVAIFFNRCVVGTQLGDTLGAWHFEIQRSLATDFAGCATDPVFSFSSCFSNWDDTLQITDYVDSITLTTTSAAACTEGGNKLVITLDTSNVWPYGSDTDKALAYRLSTSEPLVDAGDSVSQNELVMYFIVRDTTGDSDPPYVEYSYPADGTGVAAGGTLAMPLPPHFPLKINFSEQVLNVVTLGVDASWHTPGSHSTYDELVLPQPDVTIDNNKDFTLTPSKGLPPDAELQITLLSRPANFFEQATNTAAGSTPPDPEYLLHPPVIDLFGNPITASVSPELTQDPAGSGIYGADYSAATTLNEDMVLRGRVAPLIITSPLPGDTAADFAKQRVTVKAMPEVTDVKLSLDSWSELGLGSDAFIELDSGPGGALQPLSKLTRAALNSPVLMPAISGDGQWLAFWAFDANQAPQVFRQDLTRPGSYARRITDFTEEDGTETASDLDGHPISISDDGGRIVFRSTRDREGQGRNQKGEIYIWLEAKDELPEMLLQVTTSGLFDGDTQYDPYISGDGGIFFFWSRSDLGQNSGHYPQVVGCSFTTNPGEGFSCNQITANDSSTHPVDPVISVDGIGSAVAFVSAEALDSTTANEDHNYEIYLWDNAGVHQITQSTTNGSTVVVNDSPAVYMTDESGAWVYFTSNGNYEGSTVNAGGAMSTELFVYRERPTALEQEVYLPIEQITNTPGGEEVLRPALDGQGRNIAVVSNHDFTGTGQTGYQVYLLQAPRHYSSTYPSLVFGYTVEAYPAAASAVAAPGQPLPRPSIDASGTSVAFAADAQLLPDDHYTGAEAYLYHFEGRYVGFSLTWLDVARLLGQQTGKALSMTSVLPLYRPLQLKAESASEGAPGYDVIGVSFHLPDQDEDQMPDEWESWHDCLGASTVDNDVDADSDGLTNIEEYQDGTDPCNPDTDGDGIEDGVEADRCGPYAALDTDSDDDGLPDNAEDQNLDGLLAETNETDPCNADTDGDGMDDGWEEGWGFDPRSDDSGDDADGDGLTNGREYELYHDDHLMLNPREADTDGDGLNDGAEVNTFSTNPTRADTDGDGLNDYKEVARDGNAAELDPTSYHDTDPNKADSDGDEIPDAVEDGNTNGVVDPGETDPTRADSDDDGLNDYQEKLIGTDPLNPDSDGDGFNDGEEYDYRTDPGDTVSHPPSHADVIGHPPIDVFTDMDGDSLTNTAEGQTVGTDPYDMDSDGAGPNFGDGLPDGWEHTYGLDPLTVNGCTSDHDDDGLIDRAEYIHKTRPDLVDTDGDEMDDQWEIMHGLDPLQGDSLDDGDTDGLTNLEEWDLQTDPHNKDTDLDGLDDGDEVNIYGTDPAIFDSDGDGLPDGFEVNVTGTDPTTLYSDTDDAPDGWEYHYGFDPLDGTTPSASTDSDNDCLSNLDEAINDTNPFNPDTDDDLITDGWEIKMNLDPTVKEDLNHDTDGDGLTDFQEYQYNQALGCSASVYLHADNPDSDGDEMSDGWEVQYGLDPLSNSDADWDPDNDYLSNLLEYQNGSNPHNLDSDGDSLNDYQEVETYHTSPILSDTDGDGLTDADEVNNYGTNPIEPDTDNDGLSDGDEVNYYGTNPGNADSDDDQMPDGLEASCPEVLNPTTTDSTSADPDGDGLDNGYESAHGLSPCNPDTDGDGARDGIEVDWGSNPLDPFIKPGGPWAEKITNITVGACNGDNEERGALVWTGSEFGLAWSNTVSGHSNVYFGRVASDGTIVGDTLAVADGSTHNRHGSLAWTGSEFGIAWRDHRNGKYEVYFARIASDGSKIGNDLRVSQSSYEAGNPFLIWASDRFAITWSEHFDLNGWHTIWFRRITSDGTLGAAAALLNDSSITYINPVLVWDDIEIGLTFEYSLPSWPYEDHRYLYFNKLSADGQFIGTGILIYSSDTPLPSGSLAWTGSEFMAGWEDALPGLPHDMLTRISADGEELIQNLSYASGSDKSPALIWNQDLSEFILSTNGNFATVTAQGDTIGYRLPLAASWGGASYTSLVWTGQDYGAAWCEPGESGYELRFTLLESLDMDGDGLTAGDEAAYGTSELFWDTDGDEIDDGWEELHACLNPLTGDGAGDPDGDGAANLAEYRFSRNLDPCNSDTDGDGLPDGWEILHAKCLSPLQADSLADPDNDGVDNLAEYYAPSDPCASPGDQDNDGMPDSYEISYGCLKLQEADQDADYDGDGLTNLQEYQYSRSKLNGLSLDPCNPDTDGDWVKDGTEVGLGSDPVDPHITPGFKIAGGEDKRITFTDTYPELSTVTWAGSEFGVSWDDANYSSNYQPSCAMFDAYGDTVGPNHRTGTSSVDSYFTDIAGTGSQFGIVWEEAVSSIHQIYFNRTDLSGDTLLASDVQVSSSGGSYGARSPKIVWSGSEFGVAWNDYRDGNYEIYFRRLSSTGGLIGSDVRVTRNFRTQQDVTMAWTGSQYGLAWTDFRDNDYEIYFTRILANGSTVGINTRVSYTSGPDTDADMTWTGSQFGLTWLGGDGQIAFKRLTSVGGIVSGDTVGQVENLTTQGTGMYPAITWTGSEYGVVWEDYRNPTSDIYMERIAADGDTMGNEIPVSPITDVGNAFFAEIAANSDGDYGVTYTDDRDNYYTSIYFEVLGYDSDGDQLTDNQELFHYLTNPYDYDTDDDGLADGIDPDPLKTDSDSDGVDDARELECGRDPLVAANDGEAEDPDHDGLTNGTECDLGTKPYDPDTDLDLLHDEAEEETDALVVDSDEDGVGDGMETYVHSTAPMDYDSDDDGMPDGWELEHGLHPDFNDANEDADGDTLTNLEEYQRGTDPQSKDSDLDGFDDWWEVTYVADGFSAAEGQCAHDGGASYLADGDTDLLANLMEARVGTDPDKKDTDSDGMDDWWELVARLDPLSADGLDGADGDPDHDGRTNIEEYQNDDYYYTNPRNADTDGDELCDGDTVVGGACTGIEGMGWPEEIKARLRLDPNQPPGPITGTPEGGLRIDVDLGDGASVIIYGQFSASETYDVMLDDGMGHVYWINGRSEDGRLILDLSSGQDIHGNTILPGNYQVNVSQPGGQKPHNYESPFILSLRIFTYVHSGIHGPTLFTDKNGTVVRQKTYLPFGGELKGCQSGGLVSSPAAPPPGPPPPP